VEGVTESQRARSVGIGRAHAKAILLGEHAVVYGAPALALPMPQLTVTASAGWSAHSSDGQGDLSFTMTGSPSRALVTQASDNMHQLIGAFKQTVGVTGRQHLDVIIDGAVPPGRGLGSSAASSRAIVLALADLFGVELPESTVYELVQTAENLTHGRASGVDARTVGAPHPMRFQAGEAQRLNVGCEGLFIIADTGTHGSTKEAVELLRSGFRSEAGAQERFVGRATELTEAAQQALADGEVQDLGDRLVDYHDLLRAAGLSTDGIEALVDAAMRAGSLGAKITGGGMGGCVLALTRPEQAREVTRQLHEAGAVQTWVVPLKGLDSHAS
jgi:mevalonate kinase